MPDQLAQNPLTQCLNKAGSVAGTTTTFSFTANPLAFTIKGLHYTKATVTNGTTPTTDANTGVAFLPVPVNFGCVFLFGYDKGGNVKVAQGPIHALDVNGSFITAPQWPELADTICPAFALVLQVGSTGAAWTMGVSNLTGPPTGVTETWIDINTIPPRPLLTSA